MKILFIGQAPSSETDGHQKRIGRTGKRLAALLGLQPPVYRRRHSFANLLPRWPGKHGKGDVFPKDYGFGTARVFEVLKAERAIVFCGKAVAFACGVNMKARGVTFFDRFEWYGRTAMVIPHPTGINRWWNNPRNIIKASDALRCLATQKGRTQ